MNGRKWTQEEEDFLRNNLNNYTYEEIGEKINRSHDAVLSKAQNLGLRKIRKICKKRSKWTEEELVFLKDNLNKYSYEELTVIFKKSRNTVRNKVRELGLEKKPKPRANYDRKPKQKKKPKEKSSTSKQRWTEADDNFIRDNLNKYNCEEIGRKLGRTTNAIRLRIFSLGLSCKDTKKSRFRWTEDRLYLLVSLGSSFDFKTISEIIGCTKKEAIEKFSSLTKEEKERILKR